MHRTLQCNFMFFSLGSGWTPITENCAGFSFCCYKLERKTPIIKHNKIIILSDMPENCTGLLLFGFEHDFPVDYSIERSIFRLKIFETVYNLVQKLVLIRVVLNLLTAGTWMSDFRLENSIKQECITLLLTLYYLYSLSLER